MATPEKLLSVKDAEKQDKLDANKEDAKVQEVGGPEPEWSTANYANFKFDAAIGVSPDSSIPTEVDAEKADKLEEAEACPKCGKEPCECESLKEEEGDEEKKDDEKKEVVAEEGEKEDEPKTADELRQDAPAMKVNEDDTDEDDQDDSNDETLDLDLSDLMDDEDGDVVELSGDEEEVSDEDDDEDKDEEMPDFTPEEDDKVWQDDDDDMKVEVADDNHEDDAEKKVDDVMAEEGDDDEKKDDEKEMVAEEGDEDEKKDDEKKEVVAEEDEEKKDDDKEHAEPVAEGKLKISFKMDEAKKLFENNTVLTEEDKRQSRVLFESAVRSVAKQLGEQLRDAYQARFDAAKKEHEAKVAEQVDQYMSYVVEQWAKDNKVALQNQLRNRLSDSFIAGLQKLFVEHYVEVPQSKVNVVEALAKNVKSLKSKLKDAEAKAVKLHEESREAVQRERLALKKEHKARLIAEAASAVTAADRGAFVERANTVKFAGTKEFKKDLIALREQYFGAKTSVDERPSNEPVAAPLFETKQPTVSSVDAYTKIADRLTGRS